MAPLRRDRRRRCRPGGDGEVTHRDREGQGEPAWADIEWFNRQWVPDESRWADPDVSPLYADLTGFPRTLAVTCEHDPLRDQGEAFAHQLTEAAADVTLRRETGMVHNFLLCDLVSPACAAAADRIATDIAHALGSGHG